MLTAILVAAAAGTAPPQFDFAGNWAIYSHGADVTADAPERGCDDPVEIESGPGTRTFSNVDYASYQPHEVYGIKQYNSFSNLFIVYDRYNDTLMWRTPGENRSARITLMSKDRFAATVTKGKRTSASASKIYLRCPAS